MKFKDMEEGKSYWVYLEDIRQGGLGETTSAEIGGIRCTFYNGIPVEPVEVIPEREKVTIPKEVAEWLEMCKEDGGTSLPYALSSDDMAEDVYCWLHGQMSIELDRCNQDTFARAWLYGYEVEKEPLYWVRDKNELALLRREANGYINTSLGIPKRDQELVIEAYTFTEKEIKDYDARYWAFAVPVEEEE